jgi:signal transduction histidine kinase
VRSYGWGVVSARVGIRRQPAGGQIAIADALRWRTCQTREVKQSRWLTLMGAAVVSLVVVANAAGDVGFGTAGPAALVTGSTVVYVVSALTFLLWLTAPRPAIVVLLLVMAGAASAIHAADPNGPVVGLFLVMAFAPLRLEAPTAAAVAVAGALAFNVQQAATAPNPVVFILVTNGGAAFFFAMGWLLRREREQRVELEATRDAERVAATLAERSRLAREIHDVLAHTLSGMALQLEGVRLLAKDTGADEKVVTTLDRAHGLARDGLIEARRAVAALRGDAAPGPARLAVLVDEHRRIAGNACRLVVRGAPVDLSAEAELAVFRTAQEALSNIRKHTTDQTVDVGLTWTADGARLVVEDRGTTSSPDVGPTTSGYGLAGLAERAATLRGDFAAGPTDHGFRVELAVPARA